MSGIVHARYRHNFTRQGKVCVFLYVAGYVLHLQLYGALFFSFLFLDLVDYADRQEGRRCKIPVNFLLDEFANIGSIPEFDKKLATVRSRALYINIILQDLPQLMNRYPQTYGSILSNCATLLCIGCNDPETAKYLSTRSGETTTRSNRST